jgi:hypothetical protein
MPCNLTYTATVIDPQGVAYSFTGDQRILSNPPSSGDLANALTAMQADLSAQMAAGLPVDIEVAQTGD